MIALAGCGSAAGASSAASSNSPAGAALSPAGAVRRGHRGRDADREFGFVRGGRVDTVPVAVGNTSVYNVVTKVGSFTTTAVVKIWTAAGHRPGRNRTAHQGGREAQFITTSALVSFTKQAAAGS